MDDEALRNAVRRYNQGCIQGLQVDFDTVREFREELNLLDERGLWGSLVYSPLDNSVYVRSTINSVHVDVALCTQDVSHRSSISLENVGVGRCGAMVGRGEDIAYVDSVVRSLSPIVTNVASDRVVHRIVRHGDVVTVELAKRAIYVREETGFVPPLDINEEFGERGRERCPVPQKIIASWLICMVVMRSGTTDAQVMMHRQFLLSCYSSMTSVPPRMEANVNYEMMFRARSAVYQDGRLTWPVVLGLCMAENLKDGFARRIQVNTSLQNNLGKYHGQYGWRNWMGLGMILSLLAALVVVLVKFSHLSTIAAVSSTLWAFSIPLINFVFMGNILPWSVLQPDDRECPKILSLKQAVRVLFSESSKKHFKNEGLCFTGEEYSGCNRCTYQFSYDDLCEIGFEKMCDSSGREYLKVPITGKFVRMVHSLKHIDHFDSPAQPPPKVFEKLWSSGGTFPAGTDDTPPITAIKGLTLQSQSASLASASSVETHEQERNSLQSKNQKTKRNVVKMLLEGMKSQEVLSRYSNDDSHLRSYENWEHLYKQPLPNAITLGMSRLVDPSDQSDWTSLHREIAEEDQRAWMDTTEASVLVDEAGTVYHMAVSYRHDEGLRTDAQPRLTIESRRWDALGVICAKQMSLRKKSQVRVWFDQILAAHLAPRSKMNDNVKDTQAASAGKASADADPQSDADVGGVSWILNGLLPYTILHVAYIPSKNGVESDIERMWISIEHLLATMSMSGMAIPSNAQAVLKSGKALKGWCIMRPDDVPQLWKSHAIPGLDMALNVYANGNVLGAGHPPLQVLIKVARALLSGALEKCPTYHADDYKMLKLWAAQLASKDWSAHQELLLGYCTGKLPPDMNTVFSYDDVYEMISNTQERKPPGSIVGESSSTLYNKAMILASKDGRWDGVIEWVPEAVSFVRPEDSGTWCHLLNKDTIEKNTEWILHFQSNDDGTVQKIFAVGKLVNCLGGEGAYISVLLKGGSKPLGNGAIVVFSQLGWPKANDYEENFIASFSLYKHRLRDRLHNNLDHLEAFWQATVTEWTWWGPEGANPENPTDLDNFGALRGPELRWQT